MCSRGLVAVLVVAVLAGCATVPSGLPRHPVPWSVTRPPASLSLPYRVRRIYVTVGTSAAWIDEISSPGDVNEDGFADLRVRYQDESGLHSALVLSGASVPRGELRRLGRRVVRGNGPPPKYLSLRLGSYRTSPLPDLDGDGIADRARLQTRHASLRHPCGEGGHCYGWFSATELSVRSGPRTIARLGGDWYWSPPVYYDGVSYDSVVGGYQGAGDWNGDGRPDLLYDNPTFGPLVLMWTRAGLRAQSFRDAFFSSPTPTAVDLDDDGRPDLVGATVMRTGAHDGWLALVIVSPV